MSDQNAGVIVGEGYAAASLGDIGDGPGFRKIRTALGVKELGINAIVMPPGIETGAHWHDRQEEVYFVHQGLVRWTLGENDEHTVTLGPGGVLRVDAQTHRSVKNVGDTDAVYVIVGAHGGYVGRDSNIREGDTRITAGR
ncbi:MAG: cupin domain-containing protein [Solirubrobacterales bacterium]